MSPHNPWLPAEVEALLSFVKERTGDELAPVRQNDSACEDLEKAWQALGEVKGFGTRRTSYALHSRHYNLRTKAGRDTLQKGLHPWSSAEEEALLSFVKERKGDEMVKIAWNDGAWMDLEAQWQAPGNIKTTRHAK